MVGAVNSGTPASARCSRLLALAVVLASASVAGCSSKDEPPPTGGMSDADAVSCLTEPGLDTYTANMKKAGKNGVLNFQLVQSQPAPPSRGDNVWTLKITRNDNTVVSGEVTTKFSMPKHGHDSPKSPAISFDAASQTYKFDPVYLFMVGLWSLSFTAYEGSADGGSPLDTGTFLFCVQ